MEIDRRTLGPAHPDTLCSFTNLAWLYESMGDYVKAAPLYEEALRGCQKTFGPRKSATRPQPSIIWRRRTRPWGTLRRPLPLFQRSDRNRRKGLRSRPPQHGSHTGKSCRLLRIDGRLRHGRALQERSVAIDRKSVGPEHPNALMRLDNLAIWFGCVGNFRKGPAAVSTRSGHSPQGPWFRAPGNRSKPDQPWTAVQDDGGAWQGPAAVPASGGSQSKETSAANTRIRSAAFSSWAGFTWRRATLPTLCRCSSRRSPSAARFWARDTPTLARGLECLAECYCVMGRYRAGSMAPAREAAEIDNAVLNDVAPSLPDAQVMNAIQTKRFCLDVLLSATLRTGCRPRWGVCPVLEAARAVVAN